MKLSRLTSRMLIAVLTFALGLVASSFWIASRLSVVDRLEDPNCVEVTAYEQSIVKCIQSKPVSFCELTQHPNRYQHKVMRVQSTLIGYHHQHFYDPACNSEGVGTWVDYDSAQTTDKMMRAIAALKGEGMERGNIWANVIVVGRFEERQVGDPVSSAEDPNFPQIHPVKDRFRFVITSVEQVQPVSSDVPWPN